MTPTQRPTGMTGFTIVWFGQVISLIGTAMSGFAVSIWAFQASNGSATTLALIGFFNFAPTVIFSPIAGALVDRWNRKLVMMLSDLASGLMTILMLVLYLTGNLQIWQLYITGFISGIFQAFQWPAYSAAISTMIPKEKYEKAAGMMSLAEWGSGIFAPVLAGSLMAPIGLQGLLTIDIVTFIIAISALLFISVPQPKLSADGLASRGSLWQESIFGFKYIFKRPSLLGMQLVFFFGNFLATISGTLMTPMILARTVSNAQILGIVNSVGSAGGVAGSLAITAWGGPKKRVLGVVGGWFVYGILGTMLLGIGTTPVIWAIASFFSFFTGPYINASNQALWQAKVPPDIQGKVFSVRRMIAQVTGPLAMLAAGPLADKVAEPAMATAQSPLGAIFGGTFGTGAGTGMSLIIFFVGLLILAVSVISYSVSAIRHAETLIPDHDQVPDVMLVETSAK